MPEQLYEPHYFYVFLWILSAILHQKCLLAKEKWENRESRGAGRPKFLGLSLESWNEVYSRLIFF